jgi:Tfp pilus assembly protein FimT
LRFSVLKGGAKMPFHEKKGATLAELCVVLAVIGIISAMVVSFSIMVSARVTVNRSKLKAEQDLVQVEAITEAWITRQTDNYATITVSEGYLTATQGETADTLSFQENKLSGTLPDGGEIRCNTETIRSVSFQIQEKADGSDSLYFCTITYEIAQTGRTSQTLTHVFCVNPRVGDSY